MYPIKRLLVALDLSELDQTLISYTSMLVEILGIEKVYFLHIAEKLELSKSLVSKYPDLIAPLDEALEKDIKQNVEQNFTAACEYDIEVTEGNAEDKILRWADLKKIDLLVIGRKLQLEGSGLLPGKLARTIHCSILFVPEKANSKISRIMVPVDFSKASTMALEEAMLIKKAAGAQVILQNSFEVPSGYHTSGKSYEEFAEIMKSNTYEDAIEFIEGSKVRASDVEIILTLNEEKDPAATAYELAGKHNADLIIIGSKGRKELASLLLGSVADKMVRYDSTIPLLIVKDKNENLSFLQALLKL